MSLQFLKPKFSINKEDIDNNYCEFSVDQLELGNGTSLGNSLRRFLYSSVPGVAIYALRIAGATNEFTTIPGVIENVSRIVLNIKSIILTSDEAIDFPEEKIPALKLKVSGEREITAGDLECPAGIRVVNPTLVIAHSTARNSLLEVEFFAKKSRGYHSFEDNKRETSHQLGIIAIDSSYSPVELVGIKVEPTKILKGTEYERLTLSIKTNGAINPSSAVAMAAKTMKEHLNFFIDLDKEVKNYEVISLRAEKENDNLTILLEDLNLKVRSYNCLKRNNVYNLGDIVNHTENEIQAFKHLGQVSFQEIKDCVSKYNLKFKDKED